MSSKTTERPFEVSVMFHGLMVARFDRGQGYLEVGIVRGAPEHEFRIEGVEVSHFEDAMRFRDWRLTVEGAAEDDDAAGRARRHGKDQGAPFDRRSAGQQHPGTGENGTRNGEVCENHSDWIIDMEGLYAEQGQGLDTFKDALHPVIRVDRGDLRTTFRTAFMMIRMGDGQPREFGYVAEIMEMRIALMAGQSLALRANGLEEPVFVIPHPGQASAEPYEVEINNLPPHRGHGPGSASTHFQNYYLVFPKSASQRFELSLADTGRHPAPSNPPPLTQEELIHVEHEREIAKARNLFSSPFPYRCAPLFGASGTPLL